MIRGAVYPVDLGDAKRGHEQRGRRLGLVVSIEQNAWSTVTIIPTSTSAQAAVFRPEVVIAGRETRVLVDQIRTIDVSYVTGELVDYLSRDDMVQVEHHLSRYFRPSPLTHPPVPRFWVARVVLPDTCDPRLAEHPPWFTGHPKIPSGHARVTAVISSRIHGHGGRRGQVSARVRCGWLGRRGVPFRVGRCCGWRRAGRPCPRRGCRRWRGGLRGRACPRTWRTR
jgi:mRNA interferase MazF